MNAPTSELLSIVYSSSATRPFASDDLVALLAVSRENNAAADVTGMLLYHDSRFLQVLEGPEAAVRERMAVIADDTRHTGVRVMLEETLGERQFPDWTVGFAPYEESVSDGIPGYLASFGGQDADDGPDGRGLALQALIGWFEDQAKRTP